MNKFRVTCLLGADENYGEEKRVFATRRTFATRGEAAAYAETVADGRNAQVAYCTVETEWCGDGWIASGERAPKDVLVVGKFDHEIDAVNDWIEEAGFCTVKFYGLNCGGEYVDPDPSGWNRCNRCSML